MKRAGMKGEVLTPRPSERTGLDAAIARATKADLVELIGEELPLFTEEQCARLEAKLRRIAGRRELMALNDRVRELDVEAQAAVKARDFARYLRVDARRTALERRADALLDRVYPLSGGGA